ncbi:ABC transporter permease [Lactobacillus sp. ESL0791]|uniref:ABC transporter permease n=1 Tax=Lactobacillus sp. ESL0791 TaxID=2983234 RepID=UPI0023F9F6D6|nr:ABC transporter permease [Lactobacillus sp. ESL0791]MDF7639612.1 ABC transporter permease [Lactobacillus sp. ESL0791]
MSKLWTIISETYSRQVKSWGFLSLVIGPFIMLAVSLGIGYFTANNNNSSKPEIAVISQEPALRQGFIQQQKKLKIKKAVTSVTQAKKLTKKDQLQGYLIINEKNSKLQAKLYQGDSDNAPTREDVQPSLLQLQSTLNVQSAKLTASQVQKLQAQAQLKVKQLGGKTDNSEVKALTFMVIVFVMYFILILYSSIMAQEIVADKGHKIIEIIFSSTTPGIYFCGKVIAILLMIVTQIAAYIVLGFAAWLCSQYIAPAKKWLETNQGLIGQILHNVLGSIILYIILGVVAYVILAAYFGAISKSSDNASKAAQWPTLISVVAFVLAFAYMSQPHSLLVKILSYVPLFSSYFMPLRQFGSQVSPWESILSLLLLIAAIAVVLVYISKIYGRLMLQNDNSSGKWKIFKRK